MHNLFANIVKILETSKHFAQDFVNDKVTFVSSGVDPKFCDLEGLKQSLKAETMS